MAPRGGREARTAERVRTAISPQGRLAVASEGPGWRQADTRARARQSYTGGLPRRSRSLEAPSWCQVGTAPPSAPLGRRGRRLGRAGRLSPRIGGTETPPARLRPMCLVGRSLDAGRAQDRFRSMIPNTARYSSESRPQPRTLVPFRATEVPLYRFDVLVLGGGAAGASTAIAAADAGADVALVAKSELFESNTRYAQGGVAAVMAAPDSTESHMADTRAVGCGLSVPDVVATVVEGGPGAIRRLLDWGAELDVDQRGRLLLGREGGHSHPRVLHAGGDATGRELQRAITERVQGHARITCFEQVFVIDLLREQETGRVCGALAVTENGQRVGFTAGQVVLATGGAGQLYRETTNPVIATGDGVALAYRAGATLRDLEFFQFHPTCLYIAGAARVLISEIVRGAGARLRDRKGHRFMPEYHPDAELAPRDVVSRAVFDRMVRTGDTSVYLDLSEIDGDPRELFPSIARTCGLFGIDIANDPVPVRPGLHYMIGGVRVDLDGRTDVPGLWATGECASTGLHGANRMGSNSLLEGLVLGSRLGACAAAETYDVRRGAIAEPELTASDQGTGELSVNIQDVTYSLKSLMWRQRGVVATTIPCATHCPRSNCGPTPWRTSHRTAATPGSCATCSMSPSCRSSPRSTGPSLAEGTTARTTPRSTPRRNDTRWCAPSAPSKRSRASSSNTSRSANRSKCNDSRAARNPPTARARPGVWPPAT